MGVHSTTTVHYFATCDWCDKKVEITDNTPHAVFRTYGYTRDDSRGDHSFERELPDGWLRDWDVGDRYPPIYCSQSHMERAQHVAALKAIKD